MTDPELMEVFNNFAFDEVLKLGGLDVGPSSWCSSRPVRSRARGMPDRMVISGESRSSTGTPQLLSSAETEISALDQRSLQAGGQGFESP